MLNLLGFHHGNRGAIEENLDLTKSRDISIKKDSNYDYQNSTPTENYNNAESRKKSPSEINVYEYEDPEKYQ